MKILATILITILLSNDASASFGSSCSAFLNKLVNLVGLESYSPPVMSKETIKAFEELREKKLSETKNVNFRDGYYNEGKFLLSLLPKNVLDYMSQYPNSRQGIISFKNKIKEDFLLESDSIFNNIYSIMDSFHRRGSGDIRMDVRKAVTEYEKLSLSEQKRIESSFRSQQIYHLANKEWLNFGKIKISTVENGRNVQVEINGEHYLGKRVSRRGKSGILLTVPVELVKHPAWNPLNHEYIAKLASDPFRVQKMEYDVVLGHNGNFYLMDGNHRFSLYTKSTVNVVVSDPLATESLRVYFDLLNITQPSKEQVMLIHEGALNPYDLIPHHLRKEVIFEN